MAMQNFLKAYESILRKLGLQKFGNFVEIVRVNGGIVNSLWTTLRTDDLKRGKYVGSDYFGNRYYENNYYFFGRNRWVIHADRVGFNYDASQVCPEWYGWLHYKSDLIPSEDPHRPEYPWMLKHSENMTGTTGAYIGYSTTKPKISLWNPKSKPRT